MPKLDHDFLQLQQEGQKYGYVLRDFKREWVDISFDLFQWPKLAYAPATKEFIIQVQLRNSKAQYIPFIYKNLKTELIA